MASRSVQLRRVPRTRAGMAGEVNLNSTTAAAERPGSTCVSFTPMVQGSWHKASKNEDTISLRSTYRQHAGKTEKGTAKGQRD